MIVQHSVCLLLAVIFVFNICCNQFVIGQTTSSPLLPKLFEGEWNLQISHDIIHEGEVDEEEETDYEDLAIFLNVTYQNNVHRAFYSDWQNDKNYQIIIEWTSFTSGELKYIPQQEEAEEEEEEEEQEEDSSSIDQGKKMFSFEFLNRTNGYFLSQGTFNGVNPQEQGTYQFVVTSPIAFVFTVMLNNNKDVITVTATKSVAQQEPSFFQKFGFSIMIGLFFLFRMVQQKFLTPAPPPTRRSSERSTETPNNNQKKKKKKKKRTQC
eukprot:TRINITY_DN2844_c0_g2_i1.p1 TRINITY_DN2844_c0_g2~~TRINITY_DN2844_c0_g2_i1.p1  ORF type:complete len:266 (+),score=58.85 TRINITY_DN2844_c0_g2_i1:82-879(+)